MPTGRFARTLATAASVRGGEADHDRRLSAFTQRGDSAQFKHEKTTQKFLEALASGGDFGRFLSEVTIEIPGKPSVPRVAGRDTVEEFIRDFHQVAFETTVSARRVLAGDGGSAAELVFEGVHSGESGGVLATQVQVCLPCCAAYDFDDDASRQCASTSVSDLIAQILLRTARLRQSPDVDTFSRFRGAQVRDRLPE